MNKYSHVFKNIIYGLGGLFLLTACNKDFPNLLQNFNAAKDSPESKDKVLLVIVDGLAGSVVQEIAPVNLTEMTRNGLLTFGSLADPTVDFPMTSESAASTLLTGVNANKNKVTGQDLSTLDSEKYPTVFTRLKTLKNQEVSSLYTSSEAYSTYLGKDAHVQMNANDDGVITAAITGLATDSADLNVVHLTAVDKAGVASKYDASAAAYVAAIEKMDKQVQDMVNAVKARESYKNENWLVVVTSGKGGDSEEPVTDFTAFGDSKRHTYTLMYSPKFVRKILPRPNAKDVPFVGNATRFTYSGNGKVTGSLDDAKKFNLSTNEDWTITFFAKHNVANSNFNYATFFAKRAKGFEGTGWNIFSESGGWGFNSSFAPQTFGSYINDGEWHALTVVIKKSGSQDSIYMYTDGTKNAIAGKVSQNALNSVNFDNTIPLTIGYTQRDGDNLDMSISNVQIYNKAFTHDEVKRYGGVTHIDETFPFWDNLEGYWPGYDDVNVNRLTEKTGKADNFNLKGPISWVSFNELVPFFQPPINESFFRQVPNAVDVPFMIYQWLGVSVESAWQLDGKSWSPKYAQIRN
ncbi:LamG-like jellyroll fold domain-containing protein [Sphingobacterium sp. SG20118]|uniref:LamG-like jellyroll fold domain-containing protein n=1 Tax=Sphingobacterium sp. SG20118 TaxID=3367156 RepID=UPI0037DFC960